MLSTGIEEKERFTNSIYFWTGHSSGSGSTHFKNGYGDGKGNGSGSNDKSGFVEYCVLEDGIISDWEFFGYPDTYPEDENNILNGEGRGYALGHGSSIGREFEDKCL